MKKLVGSKNVAISVKMDFIEIIGQSVRDKDMFCVHWIMKGLRGRENTGETGNVRAAISPEGYPVAKFTDIFSGEVHVRPRKDGSGYDAMEFDIRVVQPALHKKDENFLGKAIINIFEKVPIITPGQPHSSEQTVSLAKDAKDGTALAHIKLTFQIKGDAPEEPQPQPEATEAEQPSQTEPDASHLVVKTPPASPAKDAGSESGSTASSDAKEETTSKKTHKHRRSSNSSAMAAIALKKKEEEMKQKEAEFEEEKKTLNEKIEAQNNEIEELKKVNQHLEARVKELEQANEQTDVGAVDPAHEKMQDDLRRLTAENEVLQERKAALTDEKDGYARKIMELTEALEEANKKLEEMRNQPAAASSADDSKDQELELLKSQIAELRAELGKKNEAPAPAKNNMVMQAVIGAAGAVLGIIIGLFI